LLEGSLEFHSDEEESEAELVGFEFMNLILIILG
jgi:hypothetical protein